MNPLERTIASGVCAYFVLCYLMVLSRQEEPHTFLRRPYGFKMCADLCSNLIGCSSFMFSHQELSCRVESGPRSRHRDERQYFIKEDKQGIDVFTGTCPNFSRLLFKRTHSQVCIDQKGQEQRRMSFTATRLLVATISSRAPLLQIFLQNYSMKRYAYISNCGINAIAYAPKLRRILLGLKTRKSVVSYDLDKYSNSTLKRTVYARSLAVDEERRLVFLSTSSPKQAVAVMTTEGRNFRYIIVVHAYCLYMSVDSKRERLFLWLFRDAKIVMTTYDGTKMTNLYTTTGSLGGMTFDYDRNHLYVHDGTSLMDISFPNKVTKVTTLPYTRGSSLYYHSGTIYAVLPKGIVTMKLGNRNIIPHKERTTSWITRIVGVC